MYVGLPQNFVNWALWNSAFSTSPGFTSVIALAIIPAWGPASGCPVSVKTGSLSAPGSQPFASTTYALPVVGVSTAVVVVMIRIEHRLKFVVGARHGRKCCWKGRSIEIDFNRAARRDVVDLNGRDRGRTGVELADVHFLLAAGLLLTLLAGIRCCVFREDQQTAAHWRREDPFPPLLERRHGAVQPPAPESPQYTATAPLEPQPSPARRTSSLVWILDGCLRTLLMVQQAKTLQVLYSSPTSGENRRRSSWPGLHFVGLRPTRHAAHVADASVELQTIAACVELPLHALAEEAGGLKTERSRIHIADVDGHGDRAVSMRVGHCHLQVTHTQFSIGVAGDTLMVRSPTSRFSRRSLCLGT